MSDPNEVKIGMFGGGGVGKTAITLRYLKGEFTEGYIPTIEDLFTKVIEFENKTINLQVIDTAGQDDFAEMRFSYYQQVKGYVLVFDISNPSSVDELINIYNDINDSIDGEIHCVIAANKADLRADNKPDLVPVEKFKEIESKCKCKVLETSAKTDQNINELYKEVLKQILSPKSSKPAATSNKKESKKQDDGGSGGCCDIA